MKTTVPASQIEEGEFFRKRTGKFVYMRLSPSSLRYHLKQDTDLVYGACFNGNVTAVSPETRVIRCTVKGLVKNIKDNRAWERLVGVKHPKRLDDS